MIPQSPGMVHRELKPEPNKRILLRNLHVAVCIFEHTLVCLLFFFHQACLFETDQLQRGIEGT